MSAPSSGRHPVAAVTALVLVGVALLGALLLAPLAVPVVWPLLFVVPGWTLMGLTRPPISATGRLGLAVVLSVAISAHLVYWLGIAVSYQRETIWLAAGLLAVPIPLVAWRHGGRWFLAEARSTGRALRREWGGFALATAVGLLVGGILAQGLWHVTRDGVAAGGSNWSDLGVHLSIAQSVNAGNFPPQVPYFAGAPLVYHWFSDFHAAIAARAAGIFSIPAFVVSSAILSAALALVVHGLARALLRGRAARRMALVAAALVVIGGGLGWVRLVGDVAARRCPPFVNGDCGDPLALVTANSYDNAWLTEEPPYFRIPSVMATGLLVHRATTAGLPMLAGSALLLAAGLPAARRRRAGWRDRPALIATAGLLGALLAPFHFFFFPLVPLLAMLYAATEGRLADRAMPRNAVLFLAPYLLALPFALPPLAQAAASGDLKLVPGWESAPWELGPGGVLFFYLTNFGLPFALALAALVMRRTPHRAFLAAWLAVLFLIPNLVQVSVVSFDMNKLFQAMWISVALLAAVAVRRWPWPAVGLVVALSAPSPLLAGAWTALNRSQVLSSVELRAADWIADHTPEGSVFVTSGWLNSPTDPAGRLRVLTYPVYVANLGLDPDPRSAELQAIFCDGDADAAAARAEAMGASYMLDTGPPIPNCVQRTNFGGSTRWRLVYEDQGLAIWQLEPAGASLSSPP